MRRLLQFRVLIVLLALALIPAATLPFAERIRAEWARYWEPRPEVEKPVRDLVEFSGNVTIYRVTPVQTYGRAWSYPPSLDGREASASGSSLRFSEAQELGEAAGAVNLSLPAIER